MWFFTLGSQIVSIIMHWILVCTGTADASPRSESLPRRIELSGAGSARRDSHKQAWLGSRRPKRGGKLCMYLAPET